MNKYKFLLPLLLICSFSLQATPATTIPVVPKNIHIYSASGSTYVDLVATGCSGYRYYIPTQHPKYDTIMAILIAAQLSNKKVQGRFDGCNYNNQGKLIGIYLKD
ncbi:hypothetical protein SOPP22_01320 [Shewanella sp. OPT22]|nr:hypothetical protein SOPP22_01320 [Shewanella sp. OPT22]